MYLHPSMHLDVLFYEEMPLGDSYTTSSKFVPFRLLDISTSSLMILELFDPCTCPDVHLLVTSPRVVAYL